MSSTAVVYYSLQGSTRKAAQALADLLDAELIELICTHPYPTEDPDRLRVGAKAAQEEAKPELQPYHFCVEDYKQLIICGPLWAGKMAPALNSFAQEHLDDILSAQKSGKLKLAGLIVSGAGIPRYKATLQQFLHQEDPNFPILSIGAKSCSDHTQLMAELQTFIQSL